MNITSLFHKIVEFVAVNSQKSVLLLIAVGVWVLVFINIYDAFSIKEVSVIRIKDNIQVYGTVDVDDINSSVKIYGEVDANLDRINGRSDVFFNNPRRGDTDKYYVIPVTVE